MTSTKNQKIKVLITGSLYLWGGGVDFVANVAKALSYDKGRDKIELFVSLPSVSLFRKVKVRLKMFFRSLLRAFMIPKQGQNNFKALGKSLFRDSSYRIPTRAVARTFRTISPRLKIVFHQDSDEGVREIFRKLKPDVALPIMPGSPKAYTEACPWIGYIFDYQHKYYPEFFDAEVQVARDAQFRDLLNGTTTVMVNSETAASDVAKFHGYTRAKVFVSPFAPLADVSWPALLRDKGFSEMMERKYSLPKKYFLICNQFWVHKSHITAFEAFGELLKHEKFKDIHLVCTGKQSDPRNPELFKGLQERIQALGIEKNMHFLGFIPKTEQIVIMNGALAVIQPTLFEGWPGGGSVYDAVSIGVPCLVSDIPTNLGAHGKNIYFFKARSGMSLYEALVEFLSKTITRPDEKYLIEQNTKAAEAMYDRLMQAIEHVLTGRK